MIALASTALVLVDLQNDFLHPQGAYGRSGLKNADIAALPQTLKPLVERVRAGGGIIISTHFTLVPGRDGEPIVSPELLQLRPFLRKGDFLPGGWGHALVSELPLSDIAIEKIAYSAFYMTRLEWVLRKLNIEQVIFGGIVTNGGVASSVRDAHVRDFKTIVLEDGCAAFSREMHELSLAALAPVARIMPVAQVLRETTSAGIQE